MDRELLEQTLADLGQPPYRARQVWERACAGAASYEEMTSLPKELRTQLTDRVPFSTLSPLQRREARDGTVKLLFQTADGHPVESVLMRYRDGRRSVCISTQSGCPLQCAFCASGQMGFKRNLSAWEIVEQALFFLREIGSAEGSHSGSEVTAESEPEPGERLSNAALMGMGEPLMNYEAVLTAVRALPDLGMTSAHGDLDRRLGARNRPADHGRPARAPGALAACPRRRAAAQADAGHRTFPDRRGTGGL